MAKGNGIDQAFQDVDRLLTHKEVLERLRVKTNTLYRLRKAGVFPQPVKISTRAVRWWQSDVDDYLRSRPKAETKGD